MITGKINCAKSGLFEPELLLSFASDNDDDFSGSGLVEFGVDKWPKDPERGNRQTNLRMKIPSSI